MIIDFELLAEKKPEFADKLSDLLKSPILQPQYFPRTEILNKKVNSFLSQNSIDISKELFLLDPSPIITFNEFSMNNLSSTTDVGMRLKLESSDSLNEKSLKENVPQGCCTIC